MKENKQFRNENKRKIWLCIGGAVAVLLICVVLVGLINGQWPWQNNGAGNYTGLPNVGTSEDETIGTDDPTHNTGDIDVTVGVDMPDNDNNSGNSGNSGNSNNSGNSGGNGTSSGNSGGNNNTEIDFDSLLGNTGSSNSGSNTGSNNSGNSSTQTTTPETTAPEATDPQTTVPETTSLVDIDIPID